MTTNEPLQSVMLEFTKMDKNGEEYVFFTIKLVNANHTGGPLGINAVAVRHVRGPREEVAGAQLRQPAPPHAVGDERALVLGHRPADLRD